MAGSGSSLTGAQKCAVLCLALEPKDGAKILGQLSPEEVEDVSREVAAMEAVPAETVTTVLRDFRNALQMAPRSVRGGVNEAEALLQHAFGPARTQLVMEKIRQRMAQGKLTQLERMEPEVFAGILSDEHPQTIAVILSHLGVKQASQALQNLPLETAADVLYRIARMDKVSPELITLLDTGIRSKTDLTLSRAMAMPGGPAAVARVLISMRGELDKQLLEQVSARDRDLAGEIESLMFVFEDLMFVDGKGIQQILRDVDSKDLALSMKGASAELRKHLLGNMSQRAAAALEEEMELLGPVRVTEVQTAQRRILDSVRELEQAGEIVVRRQGDSDEFVA